MSSRQLTFCMLITNGLRSHITQSNCALAAAVHKQVASGRMKFCSCYDFGQLLHVCRLYIYNVCLQRWSRSYAVDVPKQIRLETRTHLATKLNARNPPLWDKRFWKCGSLKKFFRLQNPQIVTAMPKSAQGPLHWPILERLVQWLSTSMREFVQHIISGTKPNVPNALVSRKRKWF